MGMTTFPLNSEESQFSVTGGALAADAGYVYLREYFESIGID